MSLSALSGLSGLSAIAGGAPPVAPSAPNVSLVSLSASSIRVTVSPVDGSPTSYDGQIKGGVYADWTDLFSADEDGVYEATGLAANTSYEFRGRATNAVGTSDWASAASPEYTWYGAPIANAATSVDWYSASLSYSYGEGGSGAAVERQLQRNGGEWVTTAPDSGDSFQKLIAGSSYMWRVRHSDNGRYSEWSNEVGFNTTTNDPTGFTASTGGASGEINLSWSVNQGGTFSAVDVERCGDSGGSPDGNWVGVGSFNPGTSTIDSSLEPGTTYWYRARTSFYDTQNYYYGDWQQTSGVAAS